LIENENNKLHNSDAAVVVRCGCDVNVGLMLRVPEGFLI